MEYNVTVIVLADKVYAFNHEIVLNRWNLNRNIFCQDIEVVVV